MHKLLETVRAALRISNVRPAGGRRLRERFWERYPLEQLNRNEWEELCDGCGQCCLLKFAETENSDIQWTNVACRLLDIESCRCRHYEARNKIVKDCTVLRLEEIDEVVSWMPATCAYRLRHEGKPLHPWHHLVSGCRNTVHEAGISVKGRAISETEIDMDDLEQHAIGLDK